MDEDIVALERELGHDPEAFQIAVAALRDDVATYGSIGSPTSDRRSSVGRVAAASNAAGDFPVPDDELTTTAAAAGKDSASRTPPPKWRHRQLAGSGAGGYVLEDDLQDDADWAPPGDALTPAALAAADHRSSSSSAARPNTRETAQGTSSSHGTPWKAKRDELQRALAATATSSISASTPTRNATTPRRGASASTPISPTARRLGSPAARARPTAASLSAASAARVASGKASRGSQSPSSSTRRAAGATPTRRSPTSPVRGGRHYPDHTRSPNTTQRHTAAQSACIDVDGCPVALTPTQEHAVAAFRGGRSIVTMTGAHSGRCFLASMLARSAAGPSNGIRDPRGPGVAVVCTAAAYVKLAGSLLLRPLVADEQLLLASLDDLADRPWAPEEVSNLSALILVGDGHGVHVETVSHLFAMLTTVPQIAVVLDAYSKDLLVRDSRSQHGELLSFHEQGGAARMPLMRIASREAFRGIVAQAGGRVNIAVRVKDEAAKLAAAKKLLREHFTAAAVVVVTLTQRKSERLAGSLDGFVPGIRSVPACHRDPVEFSDAMGAFARAVQHRDMPPSVTHDATSGRWQWAQRLVIVTDVTSLRHVPLLPRACAVIFYDIPLPSVGMSGRVAASSGSLTGAYHADASAVLITKTSLFPDVPVTAAITARGSEARREGGEGYVEVFMDD